MTVTTQWGVSTITNAEPEAPDLSLVPLLNQLRAWLPVWQDSMGAQLPPGLRRESERLARRINELGE